MTHLGGAPVGEAAQDPRCLLIADTDAKIWPGASSLAAGEAPAIHYITSADAATSLLSDPTTDLGGAFVNLNLPDQAGPEIIRELHRYKPGVPIFVLTDGEDSCTKAVLAGLGAHSHVYKPTTLSALCAMTLKPRIASRGATTAQGQNLSTLPSQLEHESHSDASFVDIPIGSITYDFAIAYDLYLRISEGRYVKITLAGDSLSRERLTHFISCGVTELHVKRESQLKYLAFCNQLALSLVGSTLFPQEVRQKVVLTYGQETLNYFRAVGVDRDACKHAQQFVQHLETLVSDFKLSQVPDFDAFMSDLALYEHGVSTSLIASLLVRPLSFRSAKPLQTVGLAALFHDIGLQRLLPGYAEDDESTLSESQKELLRSHPIESAYIMRKIPGIDPIALLGVEQHHERRDARGYPNRVGASSMSVVGEILGISDEFNRLIKSYGPTGQKSPLREMEERIFPRFSARVTEAFRTAFMKNKK